MNTNELMNATKDQLSPAPIEAPTGANGSIAEKKPIRPTAAGSATERSTLDQLVDGKRLLEIMFDEASRPSMQWLRSQVKSHMIPYIKRGRLYFFRPSSVQAWFAQKECRPSSMR